MMQVPDKYQGNISGEGLPPPPRPPFPEGMGRLLESPAAPTLLILTIQKQNMYSVTTMHSLFSRMSHIASIQLLTDQVFNRDINKQP